jgi:hypothetical protein
VVNNSSLLPPSVVSLVIEDGQQPLRLPATRVTFSTGAHHLDLMFANELDPPSVRAARQLQLQVPPSATAATSLPIAPSACPRCCCLRLAHISQHITSWLAHPPPTPAAAPQCPGSGYPPPTVWPWIAGALFLLQLCSLALFKMKAAQQRQGSEEARTPLLL